MRVQIDAARFLAAVKRIIPFTDKSSRNMPILACVKLTATTDGSIELEATDLEVAARLTVGGVTMNEPGVFLVDAAVLVKALSGLTGDLDVQGVVDAHLRITGGGRVVRLHPQDIKVWPQIPVAADEIEEPITAGENIARPKMYALDVADLLGAPLACVLTDKDAARRNSSGGGVESAVRLTRGMQCLLLRFAGGSLNAYGCNGHMLIHAALPCTSKFADALVAPSAARHISKVLSKLTERVAIREAVVDQVRYLVVMADEITMYARATRGQAATFPKVSDVWPKDPPLRLDLQASELRDMMKWLRDMSPECSALFSFDGSKLRIQVDDPDHGESIADLDVEVVAMPDPSPRPATPARWRMSPDNVLAACDAIGAARLQAHEQVRMHITDLDGSTQNGTRSPPVVFTSTDDKRQPAVRAAVMPFRL